MKKHLSAFTPLAVLAASLTSAFSFDQTHQKLTDLLKDTAVESGVKYVELKKENAALKDYLKDLAEVSREEFGEWKYEEQLSYLLNLYNATTLELVLDAYPIKSFKDELGGEEGPWKLSSVNVFGSTITLDFLEHEWIRKTYPEPRIHFALNCASEGCPPLLNEAYQGSKLEVQLEEQTKAFITNEKVNQVSKKELKLSPLFDWFKDDFIKKSGSVEAFIDPYFPEQKIKAGSVKISFTDYGWNLNEAK